MGVLKGDNYMLQAKGLLTYTAEDIRYKNHPRLTVVVRIAEGLNFSARVLCDTPTLVSNEKYSVDLKFFTIDDNVALVLVSAYLEPGRFIVIEGKRIRGYVDIQEWKYE
jgi:hypothetical protein